MGAYFFSSILDPFSEAYWYTGKRTGSYKSDFPCQKMADNVPSVSIRSLELLPVISNRDASIT